MVKRAGILAIVLWSLGLLGAVGATNEPNGRPDAVWPRPAVTNAAAQLHIPLTGFGQPGEPGAWSAGDSFTAVVTLEKKRQRTQWLLHLEASAPNGKRTNPPARMKMHSSAGNEWKFTSAPVPVRLRTLGPYDASDTKRKPPKATDKTTSFIVDKGFLGLGLDRAAAAVLRLTESKVKGNLSFGGKPFDKRQIVETRKLTDAVKLTPEEERALAGAIPALFSYFNIVQQTEGLSDILFELLDLPSMWSLLRRGGVTPGFRFLKEVEKHGTPDNPVYQMPLMMELNGEPSLRITLTVTDPKPPLLTCGGVLGIVASKPGSKDSVLTLNIVSARHTPAIATTNNPTTVAREED
jgi:hypothetical protein